MATKTETRSMIGSLMVNSTAAYIVYGSVRGMVSEHRFEKAAFAALRRDGDACAKQGGYSDAAVYMAHDGEWVQCVDFDGDE